LKNIFLSKLTDKNIITKDEYNFLFESKENWGEEEDDFDNIDKFEELIQKIIKHSEDEAIDFSYVNFPEIDFLNITSSFSKEIKFYKSLFQGSTSFSGITFEEKSDFSFSQFNMDVDFSDIKFKKIVRFYKTNFKEECDFSASEFYIEKIRDSNDKSVNFHHTVFEHIVDFQSVIFHNEVNFQSAKFKEEALFNQVEFRKKCHFYNTSFKQNIDFTECIIKEEATFKNATFDKSANFNKAWLNNVDFSFCTIKNLSLQNAKIKSIILDNMDFEKINFLYLEGIENIDLEEPKEKEIDSDAFRTREDARIVKYTLESQHNIIESNKYYRIEMDKWRNEICEQHKCTLLEKVKTFFSNQNYFNLTLFKYVSDYATNWIKVLYLIFIVSFGLSSVSLSDTDVNHGIFFSLLVFFLSVILFIIYNIKKKSEWILILYIIALFICYNDSLTLLNKIACSIYLFKSPDTFFGLLTKILFAYLFYQFVISLRQNTRRK